MIKTVRCQHNSRNLIEGSFYEFRKKIAYAATLSAITLALWCGSQVFAAPVAASAQQATNGLVQQLAGLQRLTADFEQSTKTTNNKTVQKKA